MSRHEDLAPCFIECGTVTEHLDMMRALDTVEGMRFVQLVDGEPIAEGEATLVKLSCDDSATMLVNGCLFLNVASFRYLTFGPVADDGYRFELRREGMSLAIEPRDEPRLTAEPPCRRREPVGTFDAESFVVGDDEEGEDI